MLELGTGSGYQTAILAELAEHVVTVERVPELAESAAERLRRIGLPQHRGARGREGSLGWPERGAVRRDPGHGGSAARAAGARRPACAAAAGW